MHVLHMYILFYPLTYYSTGYPQLIMRLRDRLFAICRPESIRFPPLFLQLHRISGPVSAFSVVSGECKLQLHTGSMHHVGMKVGSTLDPGVTN